VRTNLALFFSGLSLGSSADLFNRALCLRGPGSSTTSRFTRFAGCTGLAFTFALGGGGGGFLENPTLFTASASSNSSSSALFLAIFACLSSSLRLENSSGCGIYVNLRIGVRSGDDGGEVHSLCGRHDCWWIESKGRWRPNRNVCAKSLGENLVATRSLGVRHAHVTRGHTHTEGVDRMMGTRFNHTTNVQAT